MVLVCQRTSSYPEPRDPSVNNEVATLDGSRTTIQADKAKLASILTLYALGWMKEVHLRLGGWGTKNPGCAGPLRSRVLFKPCKPHSALRFRRFHERVPDESGTQVLCHQHRNSRVNPDDIGVIPVF